MAEKQDFKAALAEVKAAYDIADYMRGAGLQLKQNGVGKWKTTCPFHNEKTPSFVVNDHFQNYKCFGCGASGDLLTFVMNYENLSFIDALTKLAEDKNIKLDYAKDESGVDYKSLQMILKDTANFYCQQFNKLPESHEAKKQITDRGLTFDNRKPEWLRYGYSPAGSALTKYLQSRGYSDELLVQAGVCSQSKEGQVYDFFRSRLMFIITDRYGKPVGFSSRKLFEDDTRGKYVNSLDSAIFHKSQVLYNHALARKAAGAEKHLYIVEGQFDVAAFVEAGMPEVVAASGTAFTRGHVDECRKMVGGGGRLIFCFDGDEAGMKAATKVFMSFPDIHEDSYVVVFPEGQDPCDYRLEQGNEALRDYVQKPITLVEFMIQREKKNHDLTSVIGRSKYVAEGARIVKTVANLTLRDECIRLLSLESYTPVNTVRTAVAKATPLVLENEESAALKTLPAEELEEEEEELEEGQEVLDLPELVKQDKHFALSARFVNLGLTRPAWRKSLVRSKDLLPSELRPFLEEVGKLEAKEALFPELFSDERTARYLMQSDFSPFYKFMEMEELKEQFIYLHGCLQEESKRAARETRHARMTELLMSDESGSLAYYRQLLERPPEAE